MENPSESDVLKTICREAKRKKEMSTTHLEQLSDTFGPRFAKAWEALGNQRVKKYLFRPSARVVWIVVGKQRDYLVMPKADFCSCEDFYFKFDKGHLCYHIVAQKLAEATDQFDLIEDDDGLYEVLISEWKNATTRVSKRHQEKNTV